MLNPLFCRIVTVGLLAACVALAPTRATACGMCGGFPQKSDADYLIDGCCVAFARPDAANPFVYAPQEILKGTYSGAPIDLLVDSATRRILAAHPSEQVLLVQESPDGPWHNLGTVDPQFAALARRLAVGAAAWQGPAAGERRLQFFLPLIDHRDRRIRELAYLELGRAPYSAVRQFARAIPRSAYAPMLDEPRYAAWRGLAILLLAHSDDAADRQRILDAWRTAEQNGLTTHLAAWTAAAIEVGGTATIADIEDKYLRRPGRTADELAAIVQALAAHAACADAPLRARLVASLGLLLEHSPQYAPLVAEALRAAEPSPLAAAWQAPPQQDAQLADTVRTSVPARGAAADAPVATADVHD
jgi:hypothetical protein